MQYNTVLTENQNGAATVPGSLGKDTTCVTSYRKARAQRWELRTLAGELLPGERVAHCGHYVGAMSEGVAVHFDAADGRAGYAGLGVCGSVWACPVCSAKINAARRAELESAMEAARLAGRGVYLVTLTLQHSRVDSLADLVEAVKDAWRRVKGGATWQRMVAENAIMGHITATEATHGARAGWHPHLHILLFTYSPLTDYGLSRLREKLTARYVKMVGKNERYASSIHSVDIRDGKAAGDYITKWGLESELTGQASKKGDGVYSGLTPFQLLANYGDGDRRAGELFREWALTMKGRRQLVWSKGLRDILGVADGGEDADIAETETGAPLAVITPCQWGALRAHNLTLYVLDAIERALSVAPLWEVLAGLGVPHSDLNNGMLSRYSERRELKQHVRFEEQYRNSVENEAAIRNVEELEAARARQKAAIAGA